MNLKTAIGTYPHTKPLKDGSAAVPGLEFEWVEVSPIIVAFRRMVRGLEFDVCEMAITTYLAAREYKKPFTAIPVFLVRAFHHRAIAANTKLVSSPKDLEGKRVGVRAYTVTTGVWARGILASEYGVDLDKVEWIIYDEEHVEEFKLPGNVTQAPAGSNMASMLASGELAAGIGAGKVDSPDVKPLIPDSAAAERAWFQKTGVYPINHTVVVKDSLLQANPHLAADLCEAFAEAKQAYLLSGQPDEETAKLREIVGDDPLPYGIEPNRKALEMIVQFARDQHILSSAIKPEEMFAS